MAEIDFKAIGKRIKVARMKKNYTQQYVANYCHKSTQHISNIENGRSQLSLKLLLTIANCLNTSLDELVCDVIDRSEVIYAKEFQDIMEQATPEERRLYMQIVKSTQISLQNLKKSYQKQNEE